MKIVDVVFALSCGWIVSLTIKEILNGLGIDLGIYMLLLHYILPLISLLCLWIAYMIGRKFLFIFQAAKFFLVGVFATIVDLEVFKLQVFFIPFFGKYQLLPKTISFLIATVTKYWGNKQWAFEHYEKEGQMKNFIRFFIITLIGLGIDISAFYYFVHILGPQFGTPAKVWTEFSIILSALASAIWSFLGYKFLVFKK